MIQPTPDDSAAERPAAERPAAERPAATGLDVLTVVDYVHHDPVLGGDRRELGVVVGVDDQGVDIVPLASYRVRVSPDVVTPLTVDNV